MVSGSGCEGGRGEAMGVQSLRGNEEQLGPHLVVLGRGALWFRDVRELFLRCRAELDHPWFSSSRLGQTTMAVTPAIVAAAERQFPNLTQTVFEQDDSVGQEASERPVPSDICAGAAKDGLRGRSLLFQLTPEL